MLKRNLFKLLLTASLIAGITYSDLKAQTRTGFIESLTQPNHWADSVFKRLTRKQRIAQLFFVRAHTDRGKAYEDSVSRVIKKEKIGGLVFFQGGPQRQATLTQTYQQKAKVPLLIAMDGEWGLGMRLDSTISYPYQMTLGAIQDNGLIEEMGRQVARDFKTMGMHINFAPVVDINNNPQNPVIGFRSFGDDKYKVSLKAGAYLKGMQEEGLLVSLKHFPGHGDTNVDSHYDLPQLNFSTERLDSLEMYPFKQLIAQQAAGVMVAHMHIPSLDDTPNLPSTLSKPIVSGILKDQLGFKGLVFSDAMEMKGVVKHFPNGQADVKAIIAGNDVVELSENSKRAVKLVRKAIRKKELSWGQVNQSVKKVLAAKYWSGLNEAPKPRLIPLSNELNRGEANALNQQLANAAVTVLNSRAGIEQLDPGKRTVILAVGTAETTIFQQQLRSGFGETELISLEKSSTEAQITEVLQRLDGAQLIVSIQDNRKRPYPKLDFSPEVLKLVGHLAERKALMAVFANAYTLLQLPGIHQASSLLLNYQNSPEIQLAAARIILKQLPSLGRLPVDLSPLYKNGEGL
jgi:beta-N-acetylhexosaminidase